ncbi:MAG: ATP-binding protein [Brevundimonas sp.]|uniref:ATP-binding protein n=1 Tax=Brevundimonas sp. TaxID=1871086 RepID=UPI0024887F9D|nr:ATP-binding protein [Brevundimonas sp.]MDI1327252.1 ATP-binding protein [Brevundimonas sp.]
MLPIRVVVALLAAAVVSGGAPAVLAQPAVSTTQAAPDDALRLARFVEARAGSTDFAALDRFGQAAMRRTDREGLNRLYHVTWTILNQGDFDKASLWNRRLTEAAQRQGDDRYQDIARLNALAIRYDQGDASVTAEMRRTAETGEDWFVSTHAARLTALALIDEGKVGEGLEMLAQAQANIPENDPFAATAQAGIWEVTGMGLKQLNDVTGAADAFRKFEIDYSNPAYPRPDFDSLYNLAMMAVKVGDGDRAARFFAAHHRLTQRAGLTTLSVYDASLCATVANARNEPHAVLACLEPYGESLGEAAFVAADALPLRAIARARTGQIAGARRDVDALRRLEVETGIQSEVDHVEAEVLFAEGRHEAAFRMLRTHMLESEIAAARSYSAGIHQVTGDMQQQLAERRRQLETARSNTGLQRAIIGIGVIFLLFAGATLIWQSRQGRRLRVAQRRAEEANRAKSEFLANMSHEIRTPLNGVVSMADTLARRELEPEEHEMVDLIRSSGATLERLLSDILDSAKIESGQLTFEPAPFDLEQSVKDVAALWRVKAEDQGVAMVVEFDEALAGLVLGDTVRLRQVLTNLVSNALKFTSSGSVRLSVMSTPDGRAVFRVTDTGVGFDPDQKGRIFRRFQQADGSITRRYGGTGLGLTISNALVELMGGTALDCDSTPGTGSTFWFEIPMPRVSGIASGVEPIAARDITTTPLRILLADDHPANRKVVEIMLAATAMQLTAVEDGQQAVQVFAAGEFDLVLMDMQMPVMDGLTATRAIRALEAERGLTRTPIVMLTANAMAEHVASGRAAGADGHLTKPVTLVSLFDAIASALDGGTHREAA